MFIFQSISKERYADEKNILENTTLAIAFPVFPCFSPYFELPLHQLLIKHTKQIHLNNLTYPSIKLLQINLTALLLKLKNKLYSIKMNKISHDVSVLPTTFRQVDFYVYEDT